MTTQEKHELITSAMPFVIWVIQKKWRNAARAQNLYHDMIGIGYLALVKSAETYQAESGSFVNYCYRPIVWDIQNFLMGAYRKIAARTVYVDDDFLSQHAEPDRGSERRNYFEELRERYRKIQTYLTPRQRDLMEARMRGRTYSEIKADMNVSTKTLHKLTELIKRLIKRHINQGV